jgi:hypothetical protein
MPRRLAKLLGLPRHDQVLLVEAALVLLAVKLGLRVGGVRPCLALLGAARRRRGLHPALADLTRIALAVRRASAHLPLRLDCLPQSLAVAWLLTRRGIEAKLRFGVRMNAGALEAHAWVAASEVDWIFDLSPTGGFVTFENGSPG